MRNLLAVLAGCVAGGLANMLLIRLNTTVFFPLPPDVDMADAVAFAAALKTMPAAAFVVVVIAHLSQAFVGGGVAARLAASHNMAMALAVGAFSLAGGIAAYAMYGGPTWMLVEMPLYFVAAWGGAKLALPATNA